MDVTRNAELQKQKEEQQQKEQQEQRQQEALALLSLHEKYSPPNCKYHPLPSSLNSFGFVSYNGELLINDVFGLPGISEVEEQLIAFFIPDSVEEGRSLLSVSVDIHRDNFVEFKHLELYRYKRTEHPPVLFNHTSGNASAVAARRRTAVQTATIMEGAGGAKTRAMLSALLTGAERDSVFYLIIAVSPVSGHPPLGPEDIASRHLLPCHPLRLDLALVPYTRMHFHMPTSCPPASFLPSAAPEVTLDDEGLTFSGSPEKPFVLNFAGEESWKPFSRAVFQTSIRVPPRLHRFVRFFMKASFRFISGPFQLMLELFDEESPPDASATAPECALGCLGGTPTFNGQLFDHAMPTGYVYKIWLLAGDPMYFEDRNTQCMEFDFEYSVKFESRMTPFEVTAHSWMCPYARLPGLIVQLKHDTEDTIMSDELGVVKMHAIDMRDWFGFPPDELDAMTHTTRLILQQPRCQRPQNRSTESAAQKTPPSLSSPRFIVSSQPRKGTDGVSRQAACDALEPGTYWVSSASSRSALLQESCHEREGRGDACSLGFLGNRRWCFEWSPCLRTFLHLAILGDYTALDILAVLKKEGSSDNGPSHLLAFAQSYQHFVGPLDPGRYEMELLAMNPQTTDVSKTERHCAPLAIDARLQRRPLEDHLPSRQQWLCARERPFLPKQMHVTEDVQFVLDTKYGIPASGHHFMTLSVPRRSLLKLAVSVPQGSAPHLVVYPEGQPANILAEAYGDLFMEAESAGRYVIRFSFTPPGGSAAACPVAHFHFVAAPTSLVPVCPWARGTQENLSTEQLRQAALAAFSSTFDASMFLPKQLGSDGVEVSRPHDIWLSPSLHPEFPFTAPGASSSLRVEVILQPPWLPLRLELHRKDDVGLRRTAHAVSEYTEGRILLLSRDLPGGDYVLKFVIYDQLGENNAALLNAVRAELLEVPDLLPIEPPPKTLNARGWLAHPDVPIYATSIFAFHTEQQQQMQQLLPAGSAARTTLHVSKPTAFRIAAEPAVASDAQLKIRVLPESAALASSNTSGSSGEAMLALPSTGVIAEASENNLFAFLQPGSYHVVFEGTEPFLTTIGLMSIDALHAALPGPSSGSSGGGPSCSSTLPSVTLPSPLPPSFESEDFFFSVDYAAAKESGELLSVPLHLTSPSVIYAEAGSNFVVDFVRVGIEVVEGLWLGEQRGRQNSLKLLLDAGEHALRVRLEKEAFNDQAVRDGLLNDAKASRCLQFSLHISVHSLTKMEDRAANFLEECSAFGALPLPADLNTPNGGSSTLGSELLLKVGTFLEDQTRSMSIVLQDDASQNVDALYDWTVGGGHRERIYRLKPAAESSVYHLVLLGDGHGCQLFDLFIQSIPVNELDQMSDCKAFGSTPPPVTPTEFFKPAVVEAAAFLSTKQTGASGSPQQVLSPLQALVQHQEGFLKAIEFEVSEPSFVLAEVGFNFMGSHVEMDLITADSEQTVASGELDFLNSADSPINARQWIATHVDPGHFILRVADDHFPQQFLHHADRCFPFQFFFHIHALNDKGLQPSVVAVHPDPSVPIKAGQDLLVGNCGPSLPREAVHVP
ncbi:uncharacterized protein LOC113146624 [Cyclospora cayetanensis]|uniref:Uncharacterized protein LOC113146624 n=1 Tax=Cyclospora cayetanensis TaxID=88456 RepID=A0A6P6RRC7_9EIME|nr:uncharacterized protein LOC113146624 [Cyclospora cayetanensis]